MKNELMIKISIINWNTKKLLKECLDSVLADTSSVPVEIEVIDNASTDGSADMVKEKFPKVRLLKNPLNEGFAKAANLAIATGSQKYNLILNSDTRLEKGAVQTIYDFMEKNENVGASGPLLLNSDGSTQLSGRRFPSFKDATVHAFIGSVIPDNKYSRRYQMADWERKSTSKVDWVSGAAICLRTDAARLIGGFDEGYFMYVEDMDICWRLHQKGFDVYLLPEARVVHHIGASSKLQSAKMVKEFQKSIYRFYVKQNQGTYKEHLGFLVAGGLFVRGSIIIITNRLRKG